MPSPDCSIHPVGPLARVTPVDDAATPVDDMRRLQAIVKNLRQRNLVLARSVIDSTATIAELKQTKVQLAEAQRSAVKAHRNSLQMAATIFERTHDAMVVLDADFSLVSINRNAAVMFDLESVTAGSPVRELLEAQYRSIDSRNWIDKALECAEKETHRFELFRPQRNCDGIKPQPESSNKNENSPRWIELSFSVLDRGYRNARYLLTAYDITQRKKIEDRFQHQALHDNITRLPNRRYFVNKIEALLRKSTPDTTFAVCFLDLDNFKPVNDTLGHEAGDQLLVQVAKRIQQTTREDCFLARFGGDEFAFLVPDVPVKTVELIANRVVTELEKPFLIDGNRIHVGASVGMTRYPDDATDVQGLLANADFAMYSAKSNGRSRFHPFTAEMASELRDRKQLLSDLRDAIENENIALAYQPQWCLREDRLAGCEALLRWNRNGEIVSAAHVIDVAGSSGLIFPLERLVIRKATRQVADWQRRGFTGSVSINVSAKQLIAPDFVTHLSQAIRESGASVEGISLEVTESAIMANYEPAIARFRELNQLGVDVAIDNFRIGYPLLGSADSSPVSTLKIARTFIQDLDENPRASAVVNAVLSLGRDLDLTVVAEGVETELQRQFLQQAGCARIQGYLLSKPLDAEEFEAWITPGDDSK